MKITYEKIAVFLNFVVLALVIYCGKVLLNHSSNIGFEFKLTDLIFTAYGFFFS